MKLVKTLLAVGALCAFVAQANAVSITGQLSMGGEAVLDGPLASANGFTAFNQVYIVPLPAPSGSYAGVAAGIPGQVTYAPFQFDPLTPSPVNPLWSFTDAGTGWTYTFKLSSVSIITQNPNFLNLLGFGTANITGPGSPYTETGGVWSFTIDNPTGNAPAAFNFNFISTTATTPDGGLTMALLGFGLMGVEGLRRRFSK